MALLQPRLARQATILAPHRPAVRSRYGRQTLPVLCGGAADCGLQAGADCDHAVSVSAIQAGEGLVVFKMTRLSREQIDALLLELQDPESARQFLMEAGLVDADGQLAPPYRIDTQRKAPGDHLA
jgi:hypothetical protein